MARILLVDDERDVVTLIKFMLEKDGHMVVAAFDGVEALAKAGIEPRDETAVTPDLVILDVMMPVMDGYTVYGRLREDARTRDVPVMILTAADATPGRPENLHGPVAFLDKPFDPRALRDLVGSMLEKR